MRRTYARHTAALLAGVATIALAAPSYAADPRDARIEALERKLNEVVSELATVKKERATDSADKAALESQVSDLKRAQAAQFAQVQDQRKSDVQISLANGRPTFTSADGKYSLAIRSLLQFDSAYYSQNDRARTGTDLSSGSIFRRARVGIEGKVFGDWSYSLIYDLGGSGVEGSSVSNFYVQYDGLKWAKFRTGAYATPGGIEDQTSAGDLLFLERAAAPDLARSIAGADGRKNFLSVISSGENYYAAASWSGAKAGDAAVFDGQQAAVGYLAYRLHHDGNSNIVLSGNGSYVFKVPDTAASPAGTSTITYQARLESVVDGTRLISAGAINAQKAAVWGVEGAANWKNLYAQAGYFGFSIDRRASTLPNPNFDGWYVQGSWVLTGEPRRYNTASATWASPRPDKPFSLTNKGLGAWELAARYSVLDLNYNPGVLGAALPTGGIRGGKQKTATVGLNWYPNNAVRFLFNYEHADIDRLAATAPFRDAGQQVDIITARAQLAF